MVRSPLHGRVIILTGASSGFGALTARRLAAEGARLVLVARRRERLEALAAELSAEAAVEAGDVTVPDDRRRVVDTALQTFGRIDVLINNAGMGRLDWLKNLTPAEIDRMIDVNFRAPLQLTRLVVPHMLRAGRGHIVHVASLASFIAMPPYVIYAATKFGLKGFADALRREVEPLGIRVTAVYPAPAWTEFPDANGESVFRPFFSSRRWLFLDPERVAGAIVRALKRPRAHVYVPGWIRLLIQAEALSPRLADVVIARWITRPHWQAETRRQNLEGERDLVDRD